MPVILVGGGGEKSQDELCMLCSYDERGKKIADWKGHTGCVLCMTLSPDGTMLATGGEDKFVRVWKVDAASLALHLQGHTPVQSMSPLKGHKAKVNSVSISPCGNFVASASADCSVLLWSLKKQSQVGRMEHDADVNAVCFHGDDEVISCAGLLVLVWHRENCTIKARLEGHSKTVMCLALHPLPSCSDLVFSGSMDRTIRVFNLTTQAEVSEWKGHSAGIKALVSAPVGTFMASGSCDKSLRVWNYPSSESNQYSLGHRFTMSAICWSTDAKLLVSGGGDKKLFLFAVAQDGTLTATSVDKKKDSDDVKFVINALLYIPDTSQLGKKRSLSSASSNVMAKKDEKTMAPQKAACAADSDNMSTEDNQLNNWVRLANFWFSRKDEANDCQSPASSSAPKPRSSSGVS